MKFRDSSKPAGSFLKLKAGESVRGIFQGEPYEFKQHWVNNKSVLCNNECELCKEGLKPSFRFRLNFLIKENASYTMKIFEQGWMVYEALKALHEGDYDLSKHLMKITRNGTGTDTTYSIVPVPNGNLTTEQLETISKIPLLELGHSS
jgi:hypothetical protein